MTKFVIFVHAQRAAYLGGDLQTCKRDETCSAEQMQDSAMGQEPRTKGEARGLSRSADQRLSSSPVTYEMGVCGENSRGWLSFLPCERKGESLSPDPKSE